MKTSSLNCDGKIVVEEVFTYYSTYGIPLDMIINILWKNDIVIDWENFIKDALIFGMNKRKISVWIINSFSDAGIELSYKEINKCKILCG